jgi:hypothetical protein
VADRRRRLRVVAVAKATFASGGQGRASEAVTLLASRR